MYGKLDRHNLTRFFSEKNTVEVTFMSAVAPNSIRWLFSVCTETSRRAQCHPAQRTVSIRTAITQSIDHAWLARVVVVQRLSMANCGFGTTLSCRQPWRGHKEFIPQMNSIKGYKFYCLPINGQQFCLTNQRSVVPHYQSTVNNLLTNQRLTICFTNKRLTICFTN